MPNIETLAERIAPIGPETTAADAYARFRDDPDNLVLPVIENGRPVGLLERPQFLMLMASEGGRETYAARPVSELMDAEPVVVDAATKITTFCDAMLGEKASSLLRGFIVTRAGAYLGVGTVLSLLQATSAQTRRNNEKLVAQTRELAEAREAAQSSAEAKSRFLAVMSHEIRTPMNGVLAVAELLQRQPLGPDARAYVDTIIDSSETLLRILSDALDLSKAEAGELELDPRPELARTLMDDVQALWTPRAAQDGVKLLVSYDGDPDLGVEYDSVRLKQVFNTLIGDALKYARNSVVEASLKATVEGGLVRLEGRVRDNGPGVARRNLDTIFEPFAESPGSTGGSGLGMAICRQIVRSMGGKVWAESNAGRGTTFAFEAAAPHVDVARRSESNVSELSELQLQSQPHILIVDDNATNRVVAQALCEMFGCTSECAEDGVEALEAVRSRSFDLVLMDIKMPRMDGVQATQAIRALPDERRNVPIIALTANADPDDAKRYVEIGMSSVVEKPIKPERLRAAMNAALTAEPAAAADDGSRSAVA